MCMFIIISLLTSPVSIHQFNYNFGSVADGSINVLRRPAIYLYIIMQFIIIN